MIFRTIRPPVFTFIFALMIIEGQQAFAQNKQLNKLHLSPNVVQIEMLYSGTNIKVSSEIPTGYDAVITCRGKESPIELKRKGKALGLLWMNVGDVKFEHVPVLYLLKSSKPLKELAPKEQLEKNGIGFNALAFKTSSKEQDLDEDSLFTELVKLKKSEGLFGMEEGGVTLSDENNGMSKVEAEFHLSAKTAPGTYEFNLFIFKQGHGELFQTAELEVMQVGTSEFISSLAHEHGLLYGILAAIIAIIVGLLTGVAFSLGSKSGH